VSVLGQIEEGVGAGTGAAHLVRIVNGGDFGCAGQDTILSGALRAGVGLPHECLSGGCGKCYFDLVEGEVEVIWDDAPGLSPKARQRGRRLACQTRALSDCVIRTSPADGFVPPVLPVRRMARLSARRLLAPDMAEFTLDTGSPAEFRPGQFCLLSIPGVTGRRAYSMSNLANPDGQWQFIIRRVPSGAATSWLFEAAEEGAAIELDGPYGNAYLRPDIPRDIICIAGGSGLSPILSIARAVVREPQMAERDVAVFYGGRGPADICVSAYWEADPLLCARAELHTAISDLTADGATAWTGHRGFIHEIVQATAGHRIADCEFYVCGPVRMVEAVQSLITQSGVARERLHFDSFY